VKIKWSYSYTGSPEFDLKSPQQNEELSYLKSIDGFGGYNDIPPDGSTVTVYSNILGEDGVRDFRPALGNKFYYLVTDELVTDRQDVITNGTQVTMSFSGGRYQGSFVLSNPNGYRYLILAADYKNTLASTGGTLTYTFVLNESATVDSTFNIKPGRKEFPITPTGNTRMRVYVNDEIVVDTGVINTPATPYFTKTTQTADPVRIVIDSLAAANAVSFGWTSINLSKFAIDDTNGTLANVCSQSPSNQDVWHNGTGLIPENGDIIYSDANGLNLYDGGNSYHMIGVSIGPGTEYALISSEGRVLSRGSCVCSEVAIPVITQTDITVTKNEKFFINMEATNNPNSWSITTTCDEYLLEGGLRGSTFSYTDCDGNSRSTIVGINESKTVYASASPTVSSGTGVVTLQGAYDKHELPMGVSFENGLLQGIIQETGTYAVELNASNCFGAALPVTININCISGYNLKPVGIDINNFADTGAAVCLIGVSYDMLYHDGFGAYPALNDTIYEDPQSLNRFVGGSIWYMIDGSTYSIKVDETGRVIDTHTC
jgi:hypothetical protein